MTSAMLSRLVGAPRTHDRDQRRREGGRRYQDPLHLPRAFGVALFMVVLAAAACAPASWRRPPTLGTIDTGPGSLTEARTYLKGRWTLLSWRFFPADQPPLELDGSGTLLYDAFGNMDIEIRVDEATGEFLDREGIPATRGVISVVGRTVVDLDSRTITFVLDGQPLIAPENGPLSSRHPRHWEVNDNVLTLTTRNDNGEALLESRWQKLP
jgi:hypothetical protein